MSSARRNSGVLMLCSQHSFQSNLLGVNINGGKKICIRLRPAGDPNSFLGLDDSLLGTMVRFKGRCIRSKLPDCR